jgi:hypothetical protein
VTTIGQPEVGDGVIFASWGSWVEPDVFSFTLYEENIYFHLLVTCTLTFSEEAVSASLEVPGQGKLEIQGVLEPRP